MEREWLITLLYYRSLGTTKNELQFYKVGDHYEMSHVTKTLSASIIDRENKVELRKLREAVESLEQGGSTDLIDI